MWTDETAVESSPPRIRWAPARWQVIALLVLIVTFLAWLGWALSDFADKAGPMFQDKS